VDCDRVAGDLLRARPKAAIAGNAALPPVRVVAALRKRCHNREGPWFLSG